MREKVLHGPAGGHVAVQIPEPDLELLAMDRRLSRIEGQLRGIRRMVRQPRSCIDIAQQLAAARSALRCVTATMFSRYVNATLQTSEPMAPGEAERQVTRLLDLVDRLDQATRAGRP